MVKSLRTIQAPIVEELQEFEQRFRDSMRSPVPLLDRITFYIVRRKGKQVRPMFIFLTAKLCKNITDATYTAASLVELLHTASLVHDDVVDDANERRGFFSINALWKNKAAVLVGDFLLTRGLALALKKKQYQLLQIVSNAFEAITEGELLQLEKARRLDIDEEVYYEVIRKKTASLIASACAAGAASTTTDEEIVEKMRLFGETIGMAFQIRDDLFDFGASDVGKPLGIDIKEKKMTLPLIYALQQTDKQNRKRIIRKIKRYSEEPATIREVIEFVRQSGGLEYAHKVMLQFRDDAFEILHSFPTSPARESLEDLVNFVVEREK
ncbi:MAG: polyprenyl synthetase family protein [Lewinella sp.]|jgi:octaprenyl-diphosphate synthase|uniref:polyprenyl synthetase family protein n=1 Tax=Lewinella sp. TaxID=2004506 RepID=UPI003D6A58D5